MRNFCVLFYLPLSPTREPPISSIHFFCSFFRRDPGPVGQYLTVGQASSLLPPPRFEAPSPPSLRTGVLLEFAPPVLSRGGESRHSRGFCPIASMSITCFPLVGSALHPLDVNCHFPFRFLPQGILFCFFSLILCYFLSASFLRYFPFPGLPTNSLFSENFSHFFCAPFF